MKVLGINYIVLGLPFFVMVIFENRFETKE